MKILSAFVCCFVLMTSVVMAEGQGEVNKQLTPQKINCSCPNCECTPEAHCGCYSEEGCHCGKDGAGCSRHLSS